MKKRRWAFKLVRAVLVITSWVITALLVWLLWPDANITWRVVYGLLFVLLVLLGVSLIFEIPRPRKSP